MRTQHVFDRRNIDRGRDACCGPWNHESYKGDYRIELDSIVDVQMQRKAIGACSVIHARSRTRQSFRRTHAHIREDATDVVVLCFIKQGHLTLEHPAGQQRAGAGEFIVAKSIAPFFVECQAGSEPVYEAVHLIVPTHLMRQHHGREIAAGFCMPVQGTPLAVAEHLLSDLIADHGMLGDIAAQRLVEAALAVVADAIKGQGTEMSSRPTRAEVRLRAIVHYIDLHLSDPALSVSAVAEACSVSPRYLFSLFKQQGTTFSALVWGKRLKLAAQWLSTSSAGEAPVSEIAYRAGFKSAAHFARMFKRELKTSPRLYRARTAQAVDKTFESMIVKASASRH